MYLESPRPDFSAHKKKKAKTMIWNSRTTRRNSRRLSRSEAMSANPFHRNRLNALPAFNPKLPGPFNKYNSTLHTDLRHECATIIGKAVKARTDRRAGARMVKVFQSQEERQQLILDLNAKIKDNNWINLLEGIQGDSDLKWSVTENDRSRVMEQAKAVCRALEIMYEHVVKNVPVTWTDCCKEVHETHKTVSGWMIGEWFRDFLAGPSNAVLKSM
jgi:hypothetical protein